MKPYFHQIQNKVVVIKIIQLYYPQSNINQFCITNLLSHPSFINGYIFFISNQIAKARGLKFADFFTTLKEEILAARKFGGFNPLN